LEEVWRRIERRCGDRAGPAVHGALVGNLEDATVSRIRGWACDRGRPEVPVNLEILVDDRVLARVVANRFRADLERAGIGNGHHGFDLRMDGPLSRDGDLVQVRRADDRFALPGSPMLLKAASVSNTL